MVFWFAPRAMKVADDGSLLPHDGLWLRKEKIFSTIVFLGPLLNHCLIARSESVPGFRMQQSHLIILT